MFVICDIEWITDGNGDKHPTQLAALKVDSDWRPLAQYSSFIRLPQDLRAPKWHMAFNGGRPDDYNNAGTLTNVLADFDGWLEEDDVLLWWFAESAELFTALLLHVLKLTKEYRSAIITNHLRAYMREQPYSGSNAYVIAKFLNIDIKGYTKHFSKDDVWVAKEVLATIQYPQERFLQPPENIDYLPSPLLKISNFPYHYDPNKKLLHTFQCSELLKVATGTVGYPTLSSPLRKQFKPCACCKRAYRKALQEKNRDIIKRAGFEYVYAPGSEVYHAKECPLILNAKSIAGTTKLETAIAHGKRPCKVCMPDVVSILSKPSVVSSKTGSTKRQYKPVVYTPSSPEFKLGRGDVWALKRQKVAFKERAELLSDNLTPEETDDVYMVTQPRYAFFAAQGYKTFHLYTCPVIKRLSHLRGFRTYGAALKRGLAPCRKCNPTSKYNVKKSIPIYNQTRENEKIEDLERLCLSAGFAYWYDGKVFQLETEVGKWRFNPAVRPIRVEHIDLSSFPNETKYHVQPRLFLSLQDTFMYIKRHDESLQRKQDSRKG